MPGKSPRVIALLGPQSSGKTRLLESILCQTGARERRADGIRIFGDTSPEAKAREMGTEINIADVTFMDDPYTFIDCPGSIELLQEAYSALPMMDAAVVVTESASDKIMGLAPVLKVLEDLNVPRFIFVNKVDRASGSIRELADALGKVSGVPIVLRHLPLRKGNDVTGYVDLASERAYAYKKQDESDRVDLPSDYTEQAEHARFSMLETLADFDEHLLEELLEDVVPAKEEVYKDLSDDFRKGLIVPVLIGSALNENGVHRLLKAIRHEVPGVNALNERLGVEENGPPLAYVFKTHFMPHLGKVSIARLLRGSVKEGDAFNGNRPSGLFKVFGEKADKVASAGVGEVIGLGRLDDVKTGDTLTTGKDKVKPLEKGITLQPVYAVALKAANRNDEVKLVSSLAKLAEEDPSLSFEQIADTNEILLRGQGDVQVQLAISRLESKYGVHATTDLPQVPYKETIRIGKRHHSRYKKQSGGHGQFGDVVVEIQPRPASSGFEFKETITGGAIPRQYIPSVEAGIREYLNRGPLGFPVVDIGVTLVDGSYHTVDSSDMAFKTAGRMAMSEALPDCKPVLLEPIMRVRIHVPSEFTGQINGVVSTRRGQVLGFDARKNWPGWDTVEANMPRSEIHDLIVEIRSITMGAGTYEAEYDHLSELSGSQAQQIVAKNGGGAAAH